MSKQLFYLKHKRCAKYFNLYDLVYRRVEMENKGSKETLDIRDLQEA